MFSNKTKILITFFAAINFACVKKRPDIVQQGANLESLRTINVNEQKVLTENENIFIQKTPYTLKVTETLTKLENSKARKVVVEPDIKDFKFLDVVNFETNDPLLMGRAKSAEVLGEIGQEYKIEYEISSQNLTVCKLVTEEQISHYEKSYSRKSGNLWSVPVGGYDILGFYKVEKQLNADNRPTNVLIKVPVARENYKLATHYELDTKSFKPFKREQKIDIVPKSMFEGEWYFTETTVAARHGLNVDLGDVGGVDSALNPASKIRFIFQDNFIYGLNTNIDEKFKADDNYLNYNTVIKIPIELIDFRRTYSGSHALGFSEEKIAQKESMQNNFLALKIADVQTASSLSNLDQIFFSFSSNYRDVLDVIYGKNYFSFSIMDGSSNTVKRFSLRKVVEDSGERKYKSRQLFKKDFQIFGTFSTQKNKKIDYSVARQADIEALQLMARHNPKKDIVYHFSTQTPKDNWHRNIGREAINIWQQAFKKAGLKIQILLDESKDVELGDIRYNILNIVPNDIGRVLGFGPSLVDSDTGEIISSTMNLLLGTMYNSNFNELRNYLFRKSGVAYDFKDSSKDTKMPTLFRFIDDINQNRIEIDKNEKIKFLNSSYFDETGRINFSIFDSNEQKVLKNIVGIDSTASAEEVFFKIKDLQFKPGFRFLHFNTSNELKDFSTTKVYDEYIEKYCPEVVELAKKMSETLITTAEEVEVTKGCVDNITQIDALSTTLHEIGHNLSLRHNFQGSADKENFSDPNDYQYLHIGIPELIKTKSSSSIMDYTGFEGLRLSIGSYDIAAIRWIYKSEVEDISGSSVSVDNAKPMEASISKDKIKKYAFCTDEHRILGISPLCEAHDWGTTPLEIAKFNAEGIYRLMPYLHRNDRFNAIPPELLVQRNFASLKSLYDKWRFYVQKEVGVQRKYLQTMDAEEYQKVIDKMLNDPQNGSMYREYLKVRNLIVKLSLNIAFMSNKYCVVTNADNETDLIELSDIREELFSLGETGNAYTCSSPLVSAHLTKQKLKLVKEIGHFIEQGKSNLDPYDLNFPMNYSSFYKDDFQGTQNIRIMAFELLGTRTTGSINNVRSKFAPSLLDEPDVRFFVTATLQDRILNGISLNDEVFSIEESAKKDSLFSPDDFKTQRSSKFFVKFKNELTILVSNLMNFYGAMGVPGDSFETMSRMAALDVSATPSPKLVEGQYEDIIFGNNKFYYVRSKKSLSGALMQRLKMLDKIAMISQMDKDKIASLKTEILSNVSQLLPQPPKVTKLNALFDLMNVIQSVMSKPENQANQEFMFLMTEMFSPEFNALNLVQQNLGQKGLDLNELFSKVNDPNASPDEKAQAQQSLEQVMNLDLGELYQAMSKATGIEFKIPTLMALEERFQKILTGLETQAKKFKKNEQELNSQKGFILNLFEGISRSKGGF